MCEFNFVKLNKEGVITNKDRNEFRAYLRDCTDNQLYGVLEKERESGRMDCASLAEDELYRRGLSAY